MDKEHRIQIVHLDDQVPPGPRPLEGAIRANSMMALVLAIHVQQVVHLYRWPQNPLVVVTAVEHPELDLQL